MALRGGDALTGSGDGAAMELSCPNGSNLRFTSPFFAVVLPQSEGQDCAIQLGQGGVDMLTDTSTNVQTPGEVTMGSEHTIYGVRVFRENFRREAMVYDGAVRVWTRTTQGSGRVFPAGAKAVIEGVAGSTVSRKEIIDSDIQSAATLHAHIDVIKARAAGSTIENLDETYANLKSSYVKVLTAPADPQLRLEIAVQQVNLRIPTEALYHLKRAEGRTPQGDHERAMIALTRSIAYQQLGNQEEATRHYEKATKLDPKVLQQPSVQLYKLDPNLIKQIQPHHVQINPPTIVVNAVASPHAVPPGGPSRILVRVTSPQDTPIPDAEIRLVADGGAFRETGGTAVTGKTDATGQFVATWSCQPCAPEYVLHIEATNPGYPSTHTQLIVRIR
jgi:hypothetical protein